MVKDMTSEKVLALIENGKHSLENEKPDEAIKYLDDVLKLESDNLDAHLLKGWAFQDLEEYEKALKCFDEILKLDQNYFEAYYDKSVSLIALEDYEGALKCVDKYLELDPDNIEIINFKGTILANSGNINMALGYFNDALKLDPNYFHALKNKGMALSELEKYSEAIKFLKRALKLDPHDEDALVNLGISLAGVNKFDESMKIYDRALKLNPQSILVMYYKACTLKDMNKGEEALKCLQKALKIKPEFLEAILLEAKFYRDLEKPEMALDCYRNVLNKDPDNPYAWVGLGNVFKDLGKKEDSIKAYEKFVEIIRKNKLSDKNLEARRVREYINWIKEGDSITFSPKDKPQYWQWSTKAEYFLEDDGNERKCLEPSEDLNDPGDYWTCHKDTLAGDLILLYRVGKKNGKEYMDIKYLLMARSDAYPLDDLDVEGGWNYGCDYIPLFKFKNSLKLSEMKTEPNLKGWNALGAKFHRKVYKTKDMYWKYLIELLMKKNPDFAEFCNTFDRKKVIANIKTEKEFEDNLKENIHVLKKFGYDLEVESSQERCVGDDGYMDLLCRDKNNKDYIVIELKITKAHTSVFGQVSRYMGWVMDHKANGEAVKGIVISRGYDKKFQSALKTNPNIDHIELVDVISELGMKLK